MGPRFSGNVREEPQRREENGEELWHHYLTPSKASQIIAKGTNNEFSGCY